ncbi:MAG TPA: phage tail tape measure protein [Sphingomicrobium sp.]|nr:phage tail tape measure protein [Sphingomicrobium sp.]
MSFAIATPRVDLGFDGKDFVKGLEGARSTFAGFAKEIAGQLAGLEQNVKRIGIGLTAGITAPFAAMTVASGRGAAAFETAMGDVQAALRGIDPKKLDELSKLARTLGPEVGRSAVEAAKGIETLALTGLGADQILRGAAAATMKLAAANDAALEPAAAAVTDVMAQFGKVTADLPEVVNTVTGALDQSKLGFVDFQQAISQAGGVAGAAGVSFGEFATAIAATSSLFSSGSDAGTSFKTFITSLKPASEDAARVMKQLGLQFYDAQGNMKPLAEIANMLRERLGGLSEASQTQALKMMFGNDAMRTALGLMKLTERQFQDLQKAIEGTDAGEKLAIQMTGLEASTNRLGTAFEGLKIALGTAGLLAIFTSVADAMAGLAGALTNLPPAFHTIVVAAWALAAAIGPLILIVSTLATIALPMAFARLGLVGRAVALLVNPIGVLVNVLGTLALRFVAVNSAIGLAAAGLMRFAGPIGLVATALGLLLAVTLRQTTASAATTKAIDAAGGAMGDYEEAAAAAAQATGKAREEALKLAAVKRQEAANSLAAARASLADAQAKVQQARAAQLAQLRQPTSFGASGAGAANAINVYIRQQREQAEADAAAWETAVKKIEKQFTAADAVIRAAAASSGKTVDLNFDKPAKERKARERKDRTADLALRREEMKLQQALDVATARGDIEEQRRLQDLMDLRRREQEYRDAGLGRAAARVASERDMRDLQAARAEGLAREIDLAEKEADLRAAEIRGDEVLTRNRENELFLAERIEFWRRKELGLQEAQAQAAAELAQIEAARLDRAERAASLRAAGRSADLARLRSESGRRIRELDRAAELERRSREIYERGGGELNEDRAREQAQAEMDEEEQARLQGQFRDVIKGGFRAALDGDFKGWFKNWMAERLQRSWEDALNSIADLLFRLFNSAFSQAAQGAGGGGFNLGAALTAVAGSLGLVAGAKGQFPVLGGKAAADAAIKANTPGFATGGSFRVGGASGIDANLIQFRATKGEIVDIRRPGDSGGRLMVVPSPYFDVVVDGRAATVAAPMAGQAAIRGSADAQRSIARRQARAIP